MMESVKIESSSDELSIKNEENDPLEGCDVMNSIKQEAASESDFSDAEMKEENDEMTENKKMPRKRKRNTRFKWKQEFMEQAVEGVEKGMSFHSASKKYSVPYGTLRRYVQLAREGKSVSSIGGKPVFSDIDEDNLVKRLQQWTKRGFVLTSEEVRKEAYIYAEQLKLDHPFNKKKKIAGKDWLIRFLERHKELSLKKAPRNARGNSSKEILDKFYSLLTSTLRELDLTDKAASVFNVDEFSVSINNGHISVGSHVGISYNRHGDSVTVLACCNAKGVFIPPFIIFKGVRIKKEYYNGLPAGSKVYMTEYGNVNESAFMAWVNHFVSFKPEGPIVLILDGDILHAKSVHVLELCLKYNIVALCLPNQHTHSLQPLQASFFKELKTQYKEVYNEWISNHSVKNVAKSDFGYLLEQAWTKALTASNAQVGFRETGIFPIGRDEALSQLIQNSNNVKNGKPSRNTLSYMYSSNRKVLTSDETVKCKRRCTTHICVVNKCTQTGTVGDTETIVMCGFCGRLYSENANSLLCTWIRCEVCRNWYHKYCVGADNNSSFTCGKCID